MSDTYRTNGVNPYPNARPTKYKGIQMRSRLEAKFAQHLDSHKITWEYESECFADELGQYLPDFTLRVEGDADIYVEVKPTEALAKEWLAGPMLRVWSSIPDAHLLAVWLEESQYQSATWQWVADGPPRSTLDLIHQWAEFGPVIKGDRVEFDGWGQTVVIDLIDDDQFAALLPMYWAKPDQPWVGPPLTSTGNGWSLVMPRTATSQWWPRSIEVNNDGMVTDTYSGQAFVDTPALAVASRLWGH